MTKQDFIDYAIKNSPYNQNGTIQVGFQPYDRKELLKKIKDNYPTEFNTKRIVDFCESVGTLYFHRKEKITGDVLDIDIRWLAKIEFWDDINAVANRIGYILNCSGTIEELYISEDGRFYNHTHKLLAESEEDFFDYLTTVEFDHHPIINERVYDVLRKAGWSEKRQLDTKKFSEAMECSGIKLSQAQLDYFSSFSGISIGCDSEFCDFYSMSEIILSNDIEFFPTITTVNGDIAENVLTIGHTFSGDFHIDSNGVLLFFADNPIGRNTIEGINYLVNTTYCWRQTD